MATVAEHVDMLSPSFMMAAIQERDPENSLAKNFIWRKYFPQLDIPEDEFTWEMVRRQGILAGFYGVDGRPLPAKELDNTITRGSIARIMAMRSLSHTDVNNMRELNVLASANPDILGQSNILRSKAARHQQKIAQFIISMDDQLERTLEYLATSAMQGRIVWPPRNPETGELILAMNQLEPYWGTTTIGLDLPFPDTHKQTATTLVDKDNNAATQVAWTDPATSDVAADMDVITDLIRDTSGETPNGMTILCSNALFRKIAANEKILGMIRGNGTFPQPRGTMTSAQVRTMVADMFNWTFEIYDQEWTYASGKPHEEQVINRVRYFPVNRAIIFPTGGPLGRMLMSPHKGPNSIWATGKLPWYYDEPKPPYNTELGIAINAWPMNNRWDTIFVLDAGE